MLRLLVMDQLCGVGRNRMSIDAFQGTVDVLSLLGQEFVDLVGLLRRQLFQYVFQVGVGLVAVWIRFIMLGSDLAN